MINRIIHSFQRLIFSDKVQELSQTQHQRNQYINEELFNQQQLDKLDQVNEVPEVYKVAEADNELEKRKKEKRKKDKDKDTEEKKHKSVIKSLLDDEDQHEDKISPKGKYFDRKI